MKYRLSISDYGKILILLRDTALIGISSIFLFTFLLENEYIVFDSVLGAIMIPLTILAGPLYLIIRIRSTYTKELLIIEKEYIKSLQFGLIEFRNIKSYKYLKLNSEVLILKMFDGKKYGIGAINFNEENYRQYFDFKDMFSRIMTERNKNIKLHRKELINEEKSYLEYLPYLYFVVLLIMTIYWILK